MASTDDDGSGRDNETTASDKRPHDTPSIRAPNTQVTSIDARPTDEWVSLARDGAETGQRNEAVARLTGYLLRRRPAPRVTLELVRARSESRLRPPRSDEEVARTVDSIAQIEMKRRVG